MNTSKIIFQQLTNSTFSYGEAIATILEHNGKPISSLPQEDFIFPDNSIIRITNSGIQLLEFLQE